MSWAAIGVAGIGAVGGYLGSRNQSPTQSPTQTTTQTNAPNIGQFNPYSAMYPGYGYANALGYSNLTTPTQYYPGNTYVPPSAMTQQGVGGLNEVADWMRSNALSAQGISEHYTRGMPSYYQAAGQYQSAVEPYKRAAELSTRASGQYQAASPLYRQASQLAQNAIPGMEGINQTALGNYNFLSGAADLENNQYVQDMLAANKRQTTQALMEDWLPGINKGAAGVNALGSSRQGIAQGQGIERAMNQLANTNAATQLEAYGQGLGAQQFALGQTGNMLQNQLMPSQAMGLAGQYQTGSGDAMSMGANAMGAAGDFRSAGGNALANSGLMFGNAGNLGQQAYNIRAQGGNDAAAAAALRLQGGQAVEGYQNAALQDQMARFYSMYSEPQTRMNNSQGYFNLFQPLGTQYGGGGGSSTTGNNPNYNPNYIDPWQAAISGGMAGYGLWNSYQNSQQNPWMNYQLSNVF